MPARAAITARSSPAMQPVRSWERRGSGSQPTGRVGDAEYFVGARLSIADIGGTGTDTESSTEVDSLAIGS